MYQAQDGQAYLDKIRKYFEYRDISATFLDLNSTSNGLCFTADDYSNSALGGVGIFNSHVDFQGGQKATTYVTDYLVNRHRLPDRRKDAEIAQRWNQYLGQWSKQYESAQQEE
jgi:hypothetical protein